MIEILEPILTWIAAITLFSALVGCAWLLVIMIFWYAWNKTKMAWDMLNFISKRRKAWLKHIGQGKA